MQIFQYTNKGCRENNQDFVIHKVLPADSSIFIVADGMGGYTAGDIAAATVSNAIIEFAEMNYAQMSPTELIKEAVKYGNDCLMLKRLSINAKKMGCVIVVLLITSSDAYLTWLGDSRLYIFRDGKEVYHTEDHSVINDLAKINNLSASDIRKYSSIVTKAIMGDESLCAVKVCHIEIEQEDQFLLCTDGLHREVDIDRAINFTQADLDKLSEQMSDNYSLIRITI